jgi:hypothetical protein
MMGRYLIPSIPFYAILIYHSIIYYSRDALYCLDVLFILWRAVYRDALMMIRATQDDVMLYLFDGHFI